MPSMQDIFGPRDRSAHWLRFTKESWRLRTRDSARTQQIRRMGDLAYDILRSKVAGGIIAVANEASLQLQLSAILQTLGPLFEFETQDRFIIELEGWLPSTVGGRTSARVDILLSLGDETRFSTCAIELKYFKRANRREPLSRYDVFVDLARLEEYRQRDVDVAYLIVGTDNPHFVTQVGDYEQVASQFDFREGRSYVAGTELRYVQRSGESHPPVTLAGNYTFSWNTMPRPTMGSDDIWFLRVDVEP